MPVVIETPRDLRKKIKRAKESCASWKKKQENKQYEIKKLKSHLNSMRTNRDEFKLRCMHLEGKVAELQQEVIKLEPNPETDCQKRKSINPVKKKRHTANRSYRKS